MLETIQTDPILERQNRESRLIRLTDRRAAWLEKITLLKKEIALIEGEVVKIDGELKTIT